MSWKKKGLALLLALAAGPAGEILAADPEPLDAEFAINTSAPGAGSGEPRVASRADGSFVAVWEGKDANGKAVYLRSFDTGGDPLGGAKQVNGTTAGDQQLPAVAITRAGGLVVVWQGPEPKTGETLIYARLYDQYGDALTGELPLADGHAPAVALAESGDFLAVWQRTAKESGEDLYARLFSDVGEPLAAEIPLSQNLAGDQRAAAAAAARPTGGFFVVWESAGEYGSDVYLQLLDAKGELQLKAEQLVNAKVTAGDQARPAVAVSGFGLTAKTPDRAVVVWQGSDGFHQRIWYRLFDLAGEAQGAETLVDGDSEALDQTSPAVGMPEVPSEGLAQFVVSWTQEATPRQSSLLGVGSLIVGARRPRGPSNGNLAAEEDPEFTISSDGAFSTASSLALDAGGSFVCAWRAETQLSVTVTGRRYAATVFSDDAPGNPGPPSR